jgi:hypothetical protein
MTLSTNWVKWAWYNFAMYVPFCVCALTTQLNPNVNAFQRNFVNEVKRADEMLRKLRTFARHIDQFNKEAKEAHQPTIEVGELDPSDLDKVPSMDDLEVCLCFRHF